MFKKLKTRRGRLEHKIKTELAKDNPDLSKILLAVESYQKDNTDTIEKLKKDKKVEMNRINGALKQAIHAHGPITKSLIGSAGKRIHGALIINPNQQEKSKKISLKSLLIGLMAGSLITLFVLLIL